MSHIRPESLNTRELADLVALSLRISPLSLRKVSNDLGFNPSLLSRVQNAHSKQVGGDNLLILLRWIKQTTSFSWDEIMERIILKNGNYSR